MNRRLLEILGSGLLVFLVSYLLTVLARDAWSPLEAWVGETGLILGLVAVCVVSGAVFSLLVRVRVGSLVGGGLVVYLGWWASLEATAGPFDSPVHVVLGIFFLAGFGVGAAIGAVGRRRGARRFALE